MGNLLYFLVMILIISWAIGIYAFAAGGIIHALLAMAVIIIIIKIFQEKFIK